MSSLTIIAFSVLFIWTLGGACVYFALQAARWRSNYYELVNKPFSFWETRERNRRMFEALAPKLKLDAFSKVPIYDDDKVVRFRRPSGWPPPPPAA